MSERTITARINGYELLIQQLKGTRGTEARIFGYEELISQLTDELKNIRCLLEL